MIVNNELPGWYIFRKTKLETDTDKLYELGIKRINKLISIDNQTGDREAFYNDPHEELLGHFALRVTAAIIDDKLFSNWLVEKEGDFFSLLYSGSSMSEVSKVLNDLFEGKIIIGLQDIEKEILSSTLDGRNLLFLVNQSIPPELLRKTRVSEDSIVAVKFWFLPSLVKRRIGYLIDGWLIAPIDVIKGDVKRYFQKKLENKIEELKRRLNETDPRYPIFKQLAQAILDEWRKHKIISKFTFDSTAMGDGKLYQKFDYFPPCMRNLISRLKTTGYLSHGERLQLGLFLKRLGMPLEEQLQFWYQSAVDNVGMTWEEFDKKAGYIIRHIYGLVGSRKDYEVPKCETIINKYFCPFESLSIDELVEFLRTSYKMGKANLDNLIKLIRTQNYREACSALLSMITKWSYQKPMSHPLLFFRTMYKRFEGKSQRRKKEESKSGG